MKNLWKASLWILAPLFFSVVFAWAATYYDTSYTGAEMETLFGRVEELEEGDSPQFTGIELGHASDTTLTRPEAGEVDIEGNQIYHEGDEDTIVNATAHASRHEPDGADPVGGWYLAGDLTIYDTTSGVVLPGYRYDTDSLSTTTINNFQCSGGGYACLTLGESRIQVLADDPDVTFDFSSSELSGNQDVDFVGSSSNPVMLEFVYISASTPRWQCTNLHAGLSDALTYSVQVRALSGTNPTTDYKGEFAIDESDAGQDGSFIEWWDDSEGSGGASRVLGDIICRSYPLLQPDTAQAETDDVIIEKFPAEAYPHGATIIAIHVDTSATVSDTFLFEEWSDSVGTSQSTVESIALSAASHGEDNGVDDGAMAGDSFLNVNLDDASDDISQVIFSVCFRINPGD